MHRIKWVVSTLLALCLFSGCGGPDGPNVLLTLRSSTSGLAVDDARLMFVSSSGKKRSVYETDSEGALSLSLSSGSYVLHVQSTGIYAIPHDPFLSLHIEAPGSGQNQYDFSVPSVSGAGSMGWLDVQTETEKGAAVQGALVVAQGVGLRNADAPVSFAYTDNSGLARIPNLPAGDYSIIVYKSGVHTTQVQSASVQSGQGSETEIKVHESSVLDLPFSLAGDVAEGVSVDMVELLTGQAIPGLRAVVYEGSGTIEGIAPGTYGVRLLDDQWVLAPDDLARLGSLEFKVRADGTSTGQFEASETLKLNTPTGGTITGISPTMSWVPHAGADFQVVEVRDQMAKVVFGGFAGDGTPRLTIPASVTSQVYGVLDHLTPGVAAQYVPNQTLKRGERYRWRVFGCIEDATAPKGYRAISASHYQAGVFEVEPKPGS